jgi:hypothetical protein
MSSTITRRSYFNVGGKLLTRLKRPGADPFPSGLVVARIEVGFIDLRPLPPEATPEL